MMQPGRVRVLGGVALALAALVFAAGATAAPESKGRTIQGQVLDENDKVAATAIVHLKDTVSGAQLSAVTNKQGRYQFGELGDKTDYEVYAEKDQRRSPTRSVSRIDTRKVVVLNLKLKPKEEPPPEKKEPQ